MKVSGLAPASKMNRCFIRVGCGSNLQSIPSRELTYPTLGRSENHLQKCLSMGYVSSQDGNHESICPSKVSHWSTCNSTPSRWPWISDSLRGGFVWWCPGHRWVSRGFPSQQRTRKTRLLSAPACLAHHCCPWNRNFLSGPRGEGGSESMWKSMLGCFQKNRETTPNHPF